MTGQEVGFRGTVWEIIERFAGDDPRIRAVGEALKQLVPTREAFRTDEQLAKTKQLVAKLEDLVQQNKELIEMNKSQQERLEILAAALGACPDCWGDNGPCTACGGEGHPGAYRPDRQAFAGYVLPAVRAIQRPLQKR
jgi:hypothetical protein